MRGASVHPPLASTVRSRGPSAARPLMAFDAEVKLFTRKETGRLPCAPGRILHPRWQTRWTRKLPLTWSFMSGAEGNRTPDPLLAKQVL